MKKVVIAGACRTPIGAFQGTLSKIPAPRLGAVVVREALARSGVDPAQVDEVIMGCVVQAGLGQAPARQAALLGGVPASVGALAVNKVCGSSLKAVMIAAQMIKAGDADVLVAGGMESMNLCPHFLPNSRTGIRLGDGKLVDSLIHDGLWCAFENHHMGGAAEWTAREEGVSREDQDAYAAESQRKAVEARDAGLFKREIVAVEIPQRKGDPVVFDTDEVPRAGTTAEKLARLRPAFQKDGTVTPGNAPGITDGASAVVVLSEEKARELGIDPQATVLSYGGAALEPLQVFLAPVGAVRRVAETDGMAVTDYDRIEANEAFAVQCLADGRQLGWDWDKVNVRGGAIALGHPIGASGTRCLTTLIHILQDAGGGRGMTTLCLGGGEAVALSIEV